MENKFKTWEDVMVYSCTAFFISLYSLHSSCCTCLIAYGRNGWNGGKYGKGERKLLFAVLIGIVWEQMAMELQR